MAKCFCITSGHDQGGIDIDIHNFRAHKVKDKAQLAQRALEATNCAIEEEVNVITSHLASQTLSDNVSGLPPTPAKRLWAKWTAEELPDAVDITATYSPSCRELVQNLLSQLGNFDLSVKFLHEKVALGLQISDSPSFLNSPIFPSTISIWNAFVWKPNLRRSNQKQPPSVCFRNPLSNSLLSFPNSSLCQDEMEKLPRILPFYGNTNWTRTFNG